MPHRESARPAAPERELLKLDPWSFRVMPGEGVGCDRLVLGTTWAFAVVFAGEAVPTGLRVSGRWRARRAARRLKSHLGSLGTRVETFAIVSPRTDSVFAPRTVRGVRVIPPALLAREISGRSRAAMPHQIKRAAEELSRSIARVR
jgi:hypothetical protein